MNNRSMKLRFLAAATGIIALVAAGHFYHPWFFPIDPDPERFAMDTGKIRAWDEKNKSARASIVFVGSSTIKWWDNAAAWSTASEVIQGRWTLPVWRRL